MEYIYVGKIVNTHGIKGEIRIISYFEYKDRVFIPNHNIYIGDNRKKYQITSYRKHKNYDMITMDGYNNINQVLNLLKQKVYVDKDDLKLKEDEYCYDDLIGFEVYEKDEKKGFIKDVYLIDNTRRIMEVKTKSNIVKVPLHNDFIKKVDKNNKKIILQVPEGLF